MYINATTRLTTTFAVDNTTDDIVEELTVLNDNTEDEKEIKR